LFDTFEKALTAASELYTDGLGATVGLFNRRIRIDLGLLAQLRGVFLSGLAQCVGAIPSILKDALYLLTDGVESWHLLDSVGSLERRDATVELLELPDCCGQLPLGLRRAGSRKLYPVLLVCNVAIDLLGVVATTE
jgi:hypothetical protein